MEIVEVHSSGPFTLAESKTNGTLAQVSGQFFAVDGASRNGRYYTKGLWERALDQTKKDVADRKMLGYLGHGTEATDENLHNTALVTTDLKINESGEGIGTYEVLDTVPGRALNALLRAGVKLSVSSRATGRMLKEQKDGVPLVDPSTYTLSHFDVVREGGIASATPALVESLNESLKSLGSKEQAALREFLEYEEEPAEAHTKGVEHMDTSILETLAREKAELESKLTEALDANTKQSKDLTIAESRLSDLAASTEVTASEATKVAETLATAESTIEELKETISAFADLGTAEEITNILEKTEAYTSLGTVEDLTETVAASAESKELGTPAEIKEVFTIVEAYTSLGTVDELNKIMDSVEDMLVESEKAKAEKVLADFITETGTSEATASKLLASMDYDEAVSIAKDMSGSLNIGEAYRKPAADKPEADASESVTHKSLAARIYENY